MIPDDDILRGGQHRVTYFRYVYAKEELQTYAGLVAEDVGYDTARVLSLGELVELARATNACGLTPEDLRQFRHMDLALEVNDNIGDISYVAVEIAFYAEQSGVDRALANARLLERFTGRSARAAIAVGRDYRNMPEVARRGTTPFGSKHPVAPGSICINLMSATSKERWLKDVMRGGYAAIELLSWFRSWDIGLVR